MDLDNNILIRTSDAEYPAVSGIPTVNHNGLIIIYRNSRGEPAKAIYFDNENHIINAQ